MNQRKKILRDKAKKELNRYKAPISRLSKKLDSIKHSIKINIWVTVFLLPLILLFSCRLFYDCHTESWKTSDVIYSGMYDASYHRYKGGKVTLYYIYDTNKTDYKITWSDFDKSSFADDMQNNEHLHIVWHWWLGERLVVALENDNVTYKSYSDALNDAREDSTVMIIFILILLLIQAFTIKCLYDNVKTKREIMSELNIAKKNLSNYKNEH